MSSFPLLFSIFKWLYAAFNIGFIARVYFALRGPGVSRTVRVGICALAFVLSLALPIAREVRGNSIWIKAVSFAGHYWFAFMYQALLAWILLSVFRLVNRRFRWLVITEENRVRWRHRSCVGIAVVSLLACVGGWVNSQYPVVREEKLPLPVGAAPLRIVALSDLHLGRLASDGFLSHVVDQVEPLSPDIIVFLGDVLEQDFSPSEVQAIAAALQRLKPRLGIWGVMGNHEYFAGRGELNNKLLNQIGIRTLNDKWVMLGEKPSEKFLLIGRKDRSWPRKSLQNVIANIPEEDKNALKILLDHQPTDLEGAEKVGVFLQLSGHSHNGQFFPFNFVVPFLFENAYGYYRRGQTHYWVTSGVGAWGPRIRTSGRPEIMLIDLVPQPEPQ
ncbi:MAG: metallophosphoesterase [Betaproteobacteria bacterium]|nr:metallophosphoesterase [Betaproteobacteria bacterium]